MRELAYQLQTGEKSSEQLVQSYLEQIEIREPELNALITVNREGALEQACQADRRRKAGQALSPWDGIPIVIKDNISTEGLATTCASRHLADYIPLYDATIIARLRQHGLPILAKANLDEFAMGSSGEYSAYGAIRNPWDGQRVAGGSSGGSAAAVAAGETPWALGTDTGGSIRQPASFCGVIGLKPTYGLVSRYGIVALAPSLDQAGPLAKDVESAAILLSMIAGPDPYDATSANSPGFQLPSFEQDVVSGLKLGVPEEFFGCGLDNQVEQAVRSCLKKLEDLGAELVPVSLPSNTYAIDTYLTIVTAEASSSLARYDGVRYGERIEAPDSNTMFAKTRAQGFGPEVKRRIMLGTCVLSAGRYGAYYEQAQRVRILIQEEVYGALQKVDLLITPTTPSTAFLLGATRNPLEMYLSDLYTAVANLSGIPALSMPCGWDDQSLPIGLQIMGRPFQEALIFQVAQRLEASLEGRI